ncbi:MAG: cobalamin biosynthesis protein CobD [Dorea sp.]|nr:cobalamin biosynthesis protein CobD [Dorea sp.]
MTLPLGAGFILDLILGDPVWLYHPVRMIGRLIIWTERIIRGCLPDSKRAERWGGCLLVVIIVSVSTLLPFGILFFAYQWNFFLGLLTESFMCYQILAVKSLKTESIRVYDALRKQGIMEGRAAVSMIVGRDTENLTEEGVIKAAVETVAENTSDGVIAPMFYMAVGGAVLGFAYKAVNTMDSMVGYKNEKYMFFGTAAARLDDLVNLIPARIAALLMIAAAFFCGLDWRGAARVYRRDRFNHKSPNAAQTEAVMAGALGVQLAGDAWYFGKLYEKPAIGDSIREIGAEDIKASHRLLYGTAFLGMILFMAVKCSIAVCIL